MLQRSEVFLLDRYFNEPTVIYVNQMFEKQFGLEFENFALCVECFPYKIKTLTSFAICIWQQLVLCYDVS